MKYVHNFFTILVLVVLCESTFAQTRYLNEMFPDVLVTSDTYATNISILPVIFGQSMTPLPVPLNMDVYEPAGDTQSMRPLILYAHNSNYFPAIANGSPFGSINDSSVVEICTRLARQGYVVAAFSYRMGWNPISTSAEVKRKTIIEAAYRSFQDARSCVRYFRKTAAEDGNPYRIDVSKIALGGEGTGGYVSYGAAFLKRFDQINLLKFTDFTDPLNPVPYIDTTLLGNVNGTDVAILNLPNHSSYSSEYNMGFAFSGACGDSSWVEPGGIPFVTVQNPNDAFAPYTVGDVVESVNNDIVISSAAGGYTVQQACNMSGNNDIFKSANFTDPYTLHANARNDGYEGLFPINPAFSTCAPTCLMRPQDTCEYDNTPWQWFDETWFEAAWNSTSPPYPGDMAVCLQKLTSPNDAATARTAIDTLIGYLSPRIFVALSLGVVNDIDNLNQVTGLEVYPNPTQNILSIRVNEDSPILGIQLFDATGRKVQSVSDIRTREFTIKRNELPNGMYILKVQTDKGAISKKVVFN